MTRIGVVFRRRALAAGAVVAALAAVVAAAALTRTDGPPIRVRDAFVRVLTGPSGTTPVTLDTRLYLPATASARSPVPVVLLAHGFGGSKLSVAGDARRLAHRGYAVQTWTAEGFGRSGGEIHLDSLDWEVRDVSRLLDRLAAMPEIAKDRPGDPRAAVVGASYGGGVALLAAGTDPRIDAIVPSITWNDLAQALLPQSATGASVPGVFKRQWAGLLFGAGGSGDPECGRFAADICAAYQQLSLTGTPTARTLALLRDSSPAAVTARIKAPTLLIQGEGDTLFPLDQGDANARQIAATGTPVSVAWFTGGHDAGDGTRDDQARVRRLTDAWLDHWLRGREPRPAAQFSWSRISGFDVSESGSASTAYTTSRYPGLGGTSATDIALPAVSGTIANPPAGNPSAISSVPLAGAAAGSGLGGLSGTVTLDVPGQHVDATSAPLAQEVALVGSPTVRLRVASPTGSATLFVKLYVLAPGPEARPVLPEGLVAPIHLTGLPRTLSDGTPPVEVRLPALARQLGHGSRLRLTVATSDEAFLGPRAPVVYRVAVDGPLVLPTVAGRPVPGAGRAWLVALAVLLGVLAVAVSVTVGVARRRVRVASGRVAAEDVPLVVAGLRKAYADGFTAVEEVSFVVPRNRVVGLLGPNGAGKTTALRVLLGLTMPTAGEVRIFGRRLMPGAPVLARVGALVEGPGFLPHLSGRANLELYWESTGRPQPEAHLDEALAIAGLGSSIDRRVRTYSHGMRQRLAVAQAMLGLPELLVLDEPTDGLDPPQIAAMRLVLQEYARDGRAVLVSSHLLAEVEQMCDDVVVMNRGSVVAAGTVAELVGESPTALVEVSDPALARAALDRLGAAASPDGSDQALVVDTTRVGVAAVVSALVGEGVEVRRVVPRRRLEDAFLALVGGSTTGSGDRQ